MQALQLDTQDAALSHQQGLADGYGTQPYPESFVSPTEPYSFSGRKTERQEDNSSPQGHFKAGPGRKSRACNECKRQKMKCEVPAGNLKCKHCLRRKIECSLQFAKPSRPIKPEPGHHPRTSNVTETYEQKIDSMRDELHRVRSTLDALVDRGSLIRSPSDVPSQQGFLGNEITSTPRSNTLQPSIQNASSYEENMRLGMTRENSLEVEPGGNGDVSVEEPMQNLYEVTRLRNIRSSQAKTIRPPPDGGTELNDLITRGVISESEAQQLYITFHTSLNHYLWVGLEQVHASLLSVRRSSELLTTTILVVTALHIPTSAETFDKCYKEFLSLISSSMFSRYHSIDDVRGLCVAAFWLSDVSWKLSGHAIRIATELGIHQSFHKALNGDREHFLRARLWYMLYVCDHHFSLGYGRPPMISESLQIRELELFRELPLTNGLDQRILSQVELMSMLTRIHDRFLEQRIPPSGAALSEEDFVDMRSFNLDIDEWRMKWHPRQEPNHFIGTYPLKGIVMYSYFAKLQLNSLAVRGVSVSHGRLSPERKEFANVAASAAASILSFVLEEEEMRRALVGMPLYFHTMITFGAVFLMKVSAKWSSVVGMNVEPGYALELLERVVALFKSSIPSERHLLSHIAAGLEKMLAKSRACTPGVSRMEESSQDRLPAIMGHSDSYGSMNYSPAQAMPPMTQGFDHPLTGQWVSFNPTSEPDDLRDMTTMNEWILDSFGSDSNDAVYSLLTSQFSY